MRPNLNWRFTGVWGFLARMAILTLIVWVGSSVLSPFDDLKFDESTWRQSDGFGDPRSPRGRMYEDLENLLLQTKPDRDDVLRMLGEPDAPAPEATLGYALGMWSGFGIDVDTMYIVFDASGHVSNVYRLQG